MLCPLIFSFIMFNDFLKMFSPFSRYERRAVGCRVSGSFTCLRVGLWAFFQPLRARSVVLVFVRRQKGRRFSFPIIAGVGGRPLELFSGFARMKAGDKHWRVTCSRRMFAQPREESFANKRSPQPVPSPCHPEGGQVASCTR